MTAYVPAASIIGSSIVYASVAINDSVTFLQPYAFINTNTNAVNILHANNSVLNMATVISGGTYGLVVNTVNDCDIINTATGTIASLAGFFGYSAIYMAGDRNTLLNAGDVYSVNGTGVTMQGDDNVIDNSGTIQGWDFGISASGVDYTIRNSGAIEAGPAPAPVAVVMGGTGASKVLSNSGVIQSLSPAAGIAVQVSGANVTTITNAGAILSAGGAAIDASTSTGTLRLTNSGTIASTAAVAQAVAGTALGDTVVNSGSIEGDILLGAGNDRFDGRLGDLIGQVLGGTGDDMFTISDAATEIVELADGGVDTVRSTVSYTLASGLERLTLLGHGDLLGRGNSATNIITGNDGFNLLDGIDGLDTLYGGGGADKLIGGLGVDQYYGQAANDQFYFKAVGESGVGSGNRDTIRDWAAGDKITVHIIDANTTVSGDQAFTIDSNADFAAGEIGIDLTVPGYTIVRFNNDADAAADMEIVLVNQWNLVATDFDL